MAAPGPWSGLPRDLLLFITDRFRDLEPYCRARGVCTSWRAALPPPIPSLVTVTLPPAGTPLHPRHRPDFSAMFLHPAERSLFPLGTLLTATSCVGSSNGWLAIDCRPDLNLTGIIYLFNPLAGKHIFLLPLKSNNKKPVLKIVFGPKPTRHDHVAVAICDRRNLAYTSTRDTRWMILDVRIDKRDQIIDLAYDDAEEAGKVYCVSASGDVRVLHVPRPGDRRRRPVVEPLQPDPAAAYAPPFDAASKLTGAKHVFVFGGNLYQVWRNTTAKAVSWEMPCGVQFGMAKDEILVLRYDPERRPCWDGVKDLGGCSVFVGKNQPVLLRPEDAPGVRPNCVYWINDKSRHEPMVFDMATGTTTLHPYYAGKALNPSCRPVCWYFLDDKIASVKG